jgi:hypothetical protein
MNKKHSTIKLERTLDLWKGLIKFQFENFIELNCFIEKHISDVQKDIDLRYDRIFEISNNSKFEDEINKYEDELGNEGFKFDHEFPNRIRYSSIIQTYSMLEVHLKSLCDKLKEIYNLPLGLSDLKGGGDLEKGKLFLKKVFDLELSKLQPEWNFMKDMQKLRNRLIHHNGEYSLKDKELIKIIQKMDLLGRMWDDIDPKMEDGKNYEIRINSKELNEKFIEIVQSFFEKVSNQIQENVIHTE